MNSIQKSGLHEDEKINSVTIINDSSIWKIQVAPILKENSPLQNNKK
jgi:hypothetical protein